MIVMGGPFHLHRVSPSVSSLSHSLAHSGQQQFAARKLNYPFPSLPMRRVKERYHCPPYHTNPYRTINRTYDTQISFLPSYSLAQSHLDRNKLIGRKQRLQLITISTISQYFFFAASYQNPSLSGKAWYSSRCMHTLPYPSPCSPPPLPICCTVCVFGTYVGTPPSARLQLR